MQTDVLSLFVVNSCQHHTEDNAWDDDDDDDDEYDNVIMLMVIVGWLPTSKTWKVMEFENGQGKSGKMCFCLRHNCSSQCGVCVV